MAAPALAAAPAGATTTPTPTAAPTAAPGTPAAVPLVERGTRAVAAHPPLKRPVATGRGGAVASVDPDATAVGLEVLSRGGNAVDAAVATAAALGVTEPYSAGVGGGGFLVAYDAATGEVTTIDGRETAPASLGPTSFLDPAGRARPFPELVSSTLSVGVPGTPATWERALREHGTWTMGEALAGARRLAERGFVVDETFRQQTLDNAARFRDFTSTAQLFLPGGDAPAVGSLFRNPDLAATYALLGEQGAAALNGGELGRAVVDTVAAPPVAPGVTREVLRGGMTLADLSAYRTVERPSTVVEHEAADGPVQVHGMAPPSSGGTTVGEALQVLDALGRSDDPVVSEHRKLEAAALAFADRNRYVGDPDAQDVPTAALLSQAFADSRACAVRDDAVLPRPVAPGDPAAPVPCAAGTAAAAGDEGTSTTHLVTADAAGNVVSYTLTIEQTGGSGIVVPGRGFLLNNELTDFTTGPADPAVPDPNLPAPGKRPRSSMSPTIVLRDGRPLLAVGSPGGATIIGTTLGILADRLDRGVPLARAVAAPRVSEQNRSAAAGGAAAEPAYVDSPRGRALAALGHVFTPVPEIGAAVALEVLPDGSALAVAEPARRGGGAAGVVRPAP
ncbi:gamma-glutamyltransferase family protein [Kineococcus gypseus]|uniref:gamma-glutamyltransferase family protein n=1 Tax=Kineococcus gypseus TaxID=1637102 RepID=UPI003D7DEB0C